MFDTLEMLTHIKKKTPTSKQLAACANYVLALLNISIILLMLCRTM